MVGDQVTNLAVFPRSGAVALLFVCLIAAMSLLLAVPNKPAGD